MPPGLRPRPGAPCPPASSSDGAAARRAHAILSASPTPGLRAPIASADDAVRRLQRPTASATARVPAANAPIRTRPWGRSRRSSSPRDDPRRNARGSRGRCRARASPREPRRRQRPSISASAAKALRHDDVGRQLDRERTAGSRHHLARPSCPRSAPCPLAAEVLEHADLSSTLAPPATITNGFSTSPSKLAELSSSAPSAIPRTREAAARPLSVEECARCAEPKASFT